MAVVRAVRVVVSLLLLGAACSGDDDPGPSASVPTAATSSSVVPSTGSTGTTTSVVAAADPFAVPEVIDAAYVNRVLAALYAIDGDILRMVLSSGEIGDGVIDGLSSIYSEPQLSRELQVLPDLIADDRSQFKDPPGDRKVTVASLLRATSRCIVATVTADFSAVVRTLPTFNANEVRVLALTPAPSDRSGPGPNATPWRIAAAEVLAVDDDPWEVAPCGG